MVDPVQRYHVRELTEGRLETANDRCPYRNRVDKGRRVVDAPMRRSEGDQTLDITLIQIGILQVNTADQPPHAMTDEDDLVLLGLRYDRCDLALETGGIDFQRRRVGPMRLEARHVDGVVIIIQTASHIGPGAVRWVRAIKGRRRQGTVTTLVFRVRA